MVGGRRKKEESGDDGCFGERRRWEVPRWEEGGRRVGWGWVMGWVGLVLMTWRVGFYFCWVISG
ncbi:unnamed protein product [Linum tenue]|uniref:Uncharacterized protein n=1 Tax=Linum tenue TaxID=586396 RepID=A0AAV0Q1P9_9ROSI|nr:unnamed protein product [Linum tenue]